MSRPFSSFFFFFPRGLTRQSLVCGNFKFVFTRSLVLTSLSELLGGEKARPVLEFGFFQTPSIASVRLKNM